MKPKHHYAIFLGLMDFAFAVFVHERKHRVAKRYAMNRRNAQAYEAGVIEDITVYHLNSFKGLRQGAEWRRPSRQWLKMLRSFLHVGVLDGVQVSRWVIVRGNRLCVRDAIFFRHGGARHCGELEMLAKANNDVLAAARPWGLDQGSSKVL